MGYFDFLIDKNNNSKPNPNLEYIYRLDRVWEPNKLGDKPIKKDTIVTNVKQLNNGAYEFTCKETGETLRCNYSWALAENTKENIDKINAYENELIKFKEFERKIQMMRNEIVTLEK